MEEKKHIPTMPISVKHYHFLLGRIKAANTERNILRVVVVALAIIVCIQAVHIEQVTDTSKPAQAVHQMDGGAYGTDQDK